MDKLTVEKRSENMRRISSKNTSLEIKIRKLIHRLGYRYRLHYNNLPGKPDLAFIKRKKVIFVHGCFWHQHMENTCKIVRVPHSNTDYWFDKLKKNIERDNQHQRKLESLGWKVLIVWECELENLDKLTQCLIDFLKN